MWGAGKGPYTPPVEPHNMGENAENVGDELRKGGFGGRIGARRPRHPALILLAAVLLLIVSVIAWPEVCFSPEDRQPPSASAERPGGGS